MLRLAPPLVDEAMRKNRKNGEAHRICSDGLPHICISAVCRSPGPRGLQGLGIGCADIPIVELPVV